MFKYNTYNMYINMGRPKLKEKKVSKTIVLLPKHVKYIEKNH